VRYNKFRGNRSEYVKATEGRTTVLKEFKAYLAEHRDLIFTVLLLFVADAYLLNGALRTKLESILHRTADGLENKIAKTPTSAAQ
jgi:hypothetical protein